MLRKARELGYVSAAQFEDSIKRDPDSREREVFGERSRGEGRPIAGRPIYSDRYKLLQAEAAAKKRRISNIHKPEGKVMLVRKITLKGDCQRPFVCLMIINWIRYP